MKYQTKICQNLIYLVIDCSGYFEFLEADSTHKDCLSVVFLLHIISRNNC